MSERCGVSTLIKHEHTGELAFGDAPHILYESHRFAKGTIVQIIVYVQTIRYSSVMFHIYFKRDLGCYSGL